MSNAFERTPEKDLSKATRDQIFVIREQAERLQTLFTRREGSPDIESSRELSIALTNLEQAVMWATKHYVKTDSPTTVA